MTDDLAVFLRRMLDADEEAALVAAEQVGDSHWEQHDARIVTKADYDREVAHYGIYEYIEHIVRWDPERVLADVEAKRRLVKLHGRVVLRGGAGARYYDTTTVCRSCEPPQQFPERAFPCPTLRLLAAPYADQPGYRPEWAPDA